MDFLSIFNALFSDFSLFSDFNSALNPCFFKIKVRFVIGCMAFMLPNKIHVQA